MVSPHPKSARNPCIFDLSTSLERTLDDRRPQMSGIFQLQVKAFGLPNYGLIYTPNCRAHITIDDELIVKTNAVSGSSPVWDECFDVSLTESSTIKIHLFHVCASSREITRGRILISVKDLLPQDQKSISLWQEIRHPSMKCRKAGIVVVSLCHKPAPQPSIAFFESIIPDPMPGAPKAAHEIPKAKDDFLSGMLPGVAAEFSASGGVGGPGGNGGQTGGAGGKGGSVKITMASSITIDLELLPGSKLNGVKFNELNVCLLGTRRRLLEDICSWVNSTDDRRILWLSGGAGTGKTSVANSISVIFDNLGHLGACFFFNCDTSGLNTPSNLFGNICYQLAYFDHSGKLGVMSMILSAIRSMGHIAAFSLQTQARRLIVGPATSVELVAPVVLVIDALEESGTIQMRKELLNAIAEEFPKLPPSIKVMITSRDEPDIRHSLQGFSKEVCIDDADTTAEDIACYVEHRMTTIRCRSRLHQDWPGSAKSRELASRAEGLFIWAAIACNFIEERNPARRLNLLLSVTRNTEGTKRSLLERLDILYTSILRNAFPDDDDPLEDFRYVVGSVLILEVPLTRIGLDSLLGLGDESEAVPVLPNGHEIHLSSSNEIVSLLGSILRTESVASEGKEGPLRLLHPSLHEFLTSRTDRLFRIDPLVQHRILALRCLMVMNSQLRFNVCRIRDPSLLNKEIKDLPTRIVRHVSDGLRYSCLSVGYHLVKVRNPDTSLTEAFKTFVSEHLLHWIEVMSLLGEITKAEGCLRALSDWAKCCAKYDTLRPLFKDAIPFLRNSGHAVRLSALHTYYSALAFTPPTTNLFKRFIDNIPCAPSIVCSHPTWPTASVRVLGGHPDIIRQVMFEPNGRKLMSATRDGTVKLWDIESGQTIGEHYKVLNGDLRFFFNHVVFSPDGKKLVSTSWKEPPRLWDIESGQSIGEPFKGHTDNIKDVVFSPDGKKLATASSVVRLWDIGSGKDIGGPLICHTDQVLCVVFSSDGELLASASSDHTIQLWKVETGEAVGQLLIGHTDRVWHLTFSPDGKRLASASLDKKVGIWDLGNGNVAGEPHEGHTGSVYRVSFSPNGKILASASSDNTVRLWDAETGQAIGEPLKGHTANVNDVVFFPDGKQVVSASQDKTIRFWDLQTGNAIGGPLCGHAGAVNRVVFSPDGKKLASASSDRTVRLWDVQISPALWKPPQGHTAAVKDLVISPDGKRLATASSDNTVRLWDVRSGKSIGEALHGHTDKVNVVVFSPDGKRLASASRDKTVRIWEVKSRQPIAEVLRGHTRAIVRMVFSPDGKTLVSASSDTTLRLWDVENGQVIGKALKGHTGEVRDVVFSPNGKKIVSASADHTVRIWDVQRSQEIGALEGHTDGVWHVVFSPDGRKLASASADNTVMLWMVESGKVIGNALRCHAGWSRHIAFSPDGTKLTSVSSDGTVQIWCVENGEAIGDVFEPYPGCHLGGATPYALDITRDPWFRNFFTPTDYDSEDGMKLVSNSVNKVVDVTTSFDRWGFLRHGRTRLCRLPTTLRGCIAVQLPLIVAGGSSGAVTFLRFPGLAYSFSPSS